MRDFLKRRPHSLELDSPAVELAWLLVCLFCMTLAAFADARTSVRMCCIVILVSWLRPSRRSSSIPGNLLLCSCEHADHERLDLHVMYSFSLCDTVTPMSVLPRTEVCVLGCCFVCLMGLGRGSGDVPICVCFLIAFFIIIMFFLPVSQVLGKLETHMHCHAVMLIADSLFQFG